MITIPSVRTGCNARQKFDNGFFESGSRAPNAERESSLSLFSKQYDGVSLSKHAAFSLQEVRKTGPRRPGLLRAVETHSRIQKVWWGVKNSTSSNPSYSLAHEAKSTVSEATSRCKLTTGSELAAGVVASCSPSFGFTVRYLRQILRRDIAASNAQDSISRGVFTMEASNGRLA